MAGELAQEAPPEDAGPAANGNEPRGEGPKLLYDGGSIVPPGSPLASPPVPGPVSQPGATAPTSSRLTTTALWGALLLAGIGILGGLVLCMVLIFKGFGKDILTVRLLLSCVAIFVGTSFAALGFALFLIKAEGALRATGASNGGQQGSLETTAPGLIVFLCATVVIYLALHMQFSLNGESVNVESLEPAPAAVSAPRGGAMEAPTPLVEPPAATGGGAGSQ